MSVIPLGETDWASVSENVLGLTTRNMYTIDNPVSPQGKSLVSRPTLTEELTVGSGPIVGHWRQEGTFDGDWLVVSGNELYRVSVPDNLSILLGSTPANGTCQFAGDGSRAIVAIDGIAYSTDGATITTVTMPDDVPVGSVACINGYFLLSVLDDDLVYYIEPGETDPDALAFFTAERSPDPISSINIVMDEVWLLGSSAPEVWTATGDSTAPFQRVSGRVYSDGCAARDTAIVTSKDGFPALMWVTDTKSVVLSQGSPKRVATESIEELLKDADNLRAWAFRLNRHDFYVLTSDTFTAVYDIQMNKWQRWDSHNRDIWRAHLGIQVGSACYAGDSETGTIYVLTEGVDDDSEPVVREVSGKVDLVGKTTPCASVLLRVNSGWSPSYGYEPVLELRWSDDQAGTWSNYHSVTLGDRGEYSKDVIFRSLGVMNHPGRVFQFRFSGPARLRIDYAVINEA